MSYNNFRYFNILILTAGLSACGGGDASFTGSGQLSLHVTDAAVDTASHVYVQFSGVTVHSADGKTQTFPILPARQIDLLALQGGLSTPLLEGQVLPAGRYQWLRLEVDTDGPLDTYIVTPGGDFELTIPSGDENGLKLVRGFEVPVGGSADFTVDFDLRHSIVLSNNAGQYHLKPTLRIVDNVTVGSLYGSVDLAAHGCGDTPGNAVYLYAGAAVSPDDMGGTGATPLTSAPVKYNANLTRYDYKIGFLSPGTYTAALTCEAAQDDPSNDDAISFIATSTVNITAQQKTVSNF